MRRNWLFIVLILFATGCWPQTSEASQTPNIFADVDCPQFLPKDSPLPHFLKGVYPTGFITKLEYDKALQLMSTEGDYYYAGGISATISAEGISQSVVMSNRNDRSSLLTKNITLAINRYSIPVEPTEILDGLMPQGPFYFSWAINLNPGYYEAALVFVIDTGETKTHSWSFCIIP